MNKRYSSLFSKVISITVCAVIMLSTLILMPGVSMADKMDLTYINLNVDDTGPVHVAAYEANYVNNIYVSMQEMAAALAGTLKKFDFYNDDDGAFHVVPGYSYDPSHKPKPEPDEETGEVEPLERPESTYMSKAANWTFINEDNVTYYTFADYNLEDLYVSLLDAQLMLDIKLEYSDGVYYVDTSENFSADLNELDAAGYFDYLHGVVLGDATTGEIIFSKNADIPTPIASTTKLMTYLIVMRMVELGKISLDDIVTIPPEAARLSVSDDSVVYMYEGGQTTVAELIDAMMVASSNESALALAIYVAGSQEKFVEMMNAMAFRLGLDSAVFYNPHGLPEFFAGDITSMVENRMSAADMFKLASAVLHKYPQVEDVATQKVVWLEYLWTELYATNSLLFNMPDLIGLKTGTTDAAGKCLVSARRVSMGGKDHILVAVVLGAEFNSDRVEVSELLLKSQG